MEYEKEDNIVLKQLSLRTADGQLVPQDQLRNELMGVWMSNKRAISSRWPVKAVVEAIYMCKGVWADICYALNCSNSQLAEWLEHYPQHKEDLVKAKVGLISQAEDTLAALLFSKNERTRLDAARLILTKLGKNMGWNGTPNMTAVQVNIGDDKTAQIKAVFGIPEAAAVAPAVVDAETVDKIVTSSDGGEASEAQ